MASISNQSNPPSEDDLRSLYDEVRRGYASDGFKSLDDIRISMGADDLGAFIDQYRDDAGSAEPPGYEPNRRAGYFPAASAAPDRGKAEGLGEKTNLS